MLNRFKGGEMTPLAPRNRVRSRHRIVEGQNPLIAATLAAVSLSPVELRTLNGSMGEGAGAWTPPGAGAAAATLHLDDVT